jgi:hypothetical protein
MDRAAPANLASLLVAVVIRVFFAVPRLFPRTTAGGVTKRARNVRAEPSI